MKSKSLLALSMTACFIATGCSSTSVPEANALETLTRPEMALEDTNTTDNTENTQEKESDILMTDASQYVSSIENSNIDPAVYLDYSAGIEAGVYKWILSGDENYYILAALDEQGEPIEAVQKAINVGANNQESIDIAGGDKKGDGAGQRQGGGQKQGGGIQGGMPGGMMAMMNQGTVYQGVYINSNITNTEYQTMAIYVPKDYMETDSDGNVTGINHEAKIGNYTADTAPVVYLNEMGGWRSSSPKAADTSFLDEGMIYVSAGGRSRDAMDENGNITGKSPTQMVDLKSGLIELRANTDVIPGDMTKIISTGTSGGGQMSSILGVSGNMAVYYPYMYEAGVLGVTKNADGNYSSVFDDSVYAAQLYCPIADLENADIAYAWWWVNLADKGGVYNGSITDFEKRLQELEASAFVEYINGLNLRDSEGNALTLTGLREGSYYDAILQNISDALNAAVDNGDIDPDEAYKNYSDWLVKNDDDTWQVTDLDAFMIGTGLVSKRNKAIPGFDTMDKSAEGDAFGKDTDQVVHFSRSVAQILSDNYEELSALKGFDQEAVDDYIQQILNSDESALIEEQTNLLNATEILLANNGHNAASFAHYWRDRSGTADQHTSFSIGYNILLAAQQRGATIDYHLVWDMQHGNNEGTSTGTMIDWINEICS